MAGQDSFDRYLLAVRKTLLHDKAEHSGRTALQKCQVYGQIIEKIEDRKWMPS